MNNLSLTAAMPDYDHARDLITGRVSPEGIDLTCLVLPVKEIFYRFIVYKEWEVSEISMAKYCSLLAQGDKSFVALPVFPSRVFRQGSLFVRRNGPVKKVSDLVGRRIGIPEWAQTAAVYSRGFLQHEYGIKPNQIRWLQGRANRLEHGLPPDVEVVQAAPGTELGDLLERGEIDFLMTANNPLSFRRGSPNVRRLFPNYSALEKDYYRRTKIYPIMHTVVIRRDIFDRDPWVALSLYKAFVRAKEYAFALLSETGSPKASFAWLQPMIEEEQEIIGRDWYPYGLGQNRPTIEALLQFTHEQGLSERKLTVEELFAPSTLKDIPLTEGQRV